MDLIKAGRLLEGKKHIIIIRGKVAADTYSDRGLFHGFVTTVDSMKTYLTSVAAVLENEVLWLDFSWHAFKSNSRRREAIQQANRLLQSFTLEELVEFSDQTSALASVPYKIYQDAVSHLFTEYKEDAAASGSWKIPRLKEDPKLRMFNELVKLYASCERLKQKYSPP